MKSNTLTATLILVFGLITVSTGAILLNRNEVVAHYTLMGGLVVVFIGYVLLIVKLFHKR